MNLALKMTIKHYYQADFWNTSWRLECVLERKCLTSTQFMNITTKKKKKRQLGYIMVSQFGCHMKNLEYLRYEK